MAIGDRLSSIVRPDGSGRVAAVDQLIQSLGGKVESFYFVFDTSDAYVIVDLPDNSSVAAVAAVVGSSGALSSYETVVLLTPSEVDEAMRNAASYRPRGVKRDRAVGPRARITGRVATSDLDSRCPIWLSGISRRAGCRWTEPLTFTCHARRSGQLIPGLGPRRRRGSGESTPGPPGRSEANPDIGPSSGWSRFPTRGCSRARTGPAQPGLRPQVRKSSP